LKIVSKDSIASTSAGEGSNLIEHQEVTLPTRRHEEKKKINHQGSATKCPKVSLRHKVSKNKLDQAFEAQAKRKL
jgi:hypothetical protein